MPPVRFKSRAAAVPQYEEEESCFILTSARAALLVAWLLSISIAFYAGNLTHKCSAETVHRSALDEAKAAVMGGFRAVESIKGSKLPHKHWQPKAALARGLKSVPQPPSRSTTRSASFSGSSTRAAASSSPSGEPALRATAAVEERRSAEDGDAGLVDSTSASAVAVAQLPAASEVFYDQCYDQYRGAPYQWSEYIPADPVLVAAREKMRRPTDAELEGTAFVTMATGDSAARGATVLMQSLIDSGTRVPNLLILLFRGGHGGKWCDSYPRKQARRGDMNWPCSRPDSTAEEVAHPEFLLAWERMGVKYQIIDPIPDTNWTTIPGGRSSWWGMSFNKLRVFHLVNLRKLVWMDSDTQVYHNIDHLMLEPAGTMAYMQECMLVNSYGKTAGSTWVVEPSWGEFHRIEKLYSGPVPGSDPPKGWVFTDMQVAAHGFGVPREDQRSGTNLPWTYDESQALLPGLRAFLPEFRAMTDAGWKDFVLRHTPKFLKPRVEQLKGALPPEGLWPEYEDRAAKVGHPTWRMLDVRYEALAGNCKDNGELLRDLGPDFFSVHFTCMPVTDNANMHKPSDYKSEHDLLEAIMTRAPRCLRYYMLRWYETFVRGMGARYPPPYYNGTLEVAVDSAAADAYRDALIAGKYKKDKKA